MDVASAFLKMEDIHLLRAIEPALRLSWVQRENEEKRREACRYHERECDEGMEEEDVMRCTMSKRDNMAAKEQLSRLLFKPEL